MTTETYDAIVVGARCAGAATARLMAEAGMRVLAVDWAKPGTDTISSHVLTRGAVMQLARWGLLERLRAAGTPDIARTTLHFGTDVVAIDTSSRDGMPGVIAPRRYLLDRILAGYAAEAGVEVRYRTAFRDVLRDGSGRVVGACLSDPEGRLYSVRAPLLVGADGLNSSVARKVGSRIYARESHTLSHVYGYYTGMADTGNHGHFARGSSIGIAPTNGGAQCVIASAPPDHLRHLLRSMGPAAALRDIARAISPAVEDMLASARLAERPVVFAGTPGFYRECAGPGWALVGDAGYFRDPVTSHGITDAFRDADMLARSALLGTDEALLGYQHARDCVTRPLFDITDRIARFDQSPEDIKLAFMDLSQAMRDEQRWMRNAFADWALAA
jgi:flavin-dependent dehydrogenase